MCYNWPRICSVCRNHNPQSWPITALATKATTEAGITYHFWIPEFILPEYLKSSFRNIWVHPSGIPESILPEYLSLSFGISEFTHDFQWGSYCSMILFLCSVVQVIVYPFVRFLVFSFLCLLVLDGFWLLIDALVSIVFCYERNIILITIRSFLLLINISVVSTSFYGEKQHACEINNQLFANYFSGWFECTDNNTI